MRYPYGIRLRDASGGLRVVLAHCGSAQRERRRQRPGGRLEPQPAGLRFPSPMVLRRLPSLAFYIRVASLIRMPTSYRANLRRTLKSCSRVLLNDQLWDLLEPLLPPWPDEGARSAAGAGSAVPAEHLVRAAYRDRLGRPSAGTRLQVRYDVLAANQAVDQRRGARRSASDPACPAERGKRDRLVPGGDRRQPHRHEKKGVPGP